MVIVNNSQLPITHIGDIVITSCSSQQQMQLEDVYRVLGMKKNLLSFLNLTDCGNYIVFGPKDVKVCQKVKIVDTPIMEGQKGILYTFC